MPRGHKMNDKNNIRPYESYALYVLQKVWNDEFKHLELSDRPDLLDNIQKFGIEVVCPFVEKEKMLDSYYYNNLEGKTLDEVSSHGLQKFRSFSRDVIINKNTNKISAFSKPIHTSHFDVSTVFDYIDKKATKLNKGLYKYPENISLYLNTCYYSLDNSKIEVATKLLDYCNLTKSKYDYYFKEIFYDCIAFIYRINLLDSTIQKIDTLEC